MTVQCCQCKKIRMQNYWDNPPRPVEGTVSSTYCPVCLALAKSSLENERRLLAS